MRRIFAKAGVFLLILAGAAARADDPPAASAPSADFIAGFSGHDPIYFILGVNPTDAKFQISFKYRPLGQTRNPGERQWYDNLLLAYTQTSLWDLSAASQPFRDTNYKPALLYQIDKPDATWLPGNRRSYVRVAFQHESNGRDGAGSRSLNIAYFEPSLSFDIAERWTLTARPRVWAYVLGRRDNADIGRFRGYASLVLALTQQDGLGVVVAGTGNPSRGRGALTTDVSYPLSLLGINLYLTAQLFTGYGESLISYNQRDTRLRGGIALMR